MDNSADALRAILAAYQHVAAASWPDLTPTLKSRAARWATAFATELKSELEGHLREVAPPRSNVRVMWQTGSTFLFGGCNEAFAADAGLKIAERLGTDDSDKRLPWRHQAAKYRRAGRALFMKSRKGDAAAKSQACLLQSAVMVACTAMRYGPPSKSVRA